MKIKHVIFSVIHRLLIFFLLIVSFRSVSQNEPKRIIPVFADSNPGDSIHTAVTDFFREIKKSLNCDFTLSPARNYQGKGILVATQQNLPLQKITLPGALKSYGPEGLYIKGNADCLQVFGNSNLAIKEALYIYLGELGFRYYMPGSEWEVIPSLSTIYKKTSILTKPDYEYRSISCGHGFGRSKKIEDEFNFWGKANNMGGAFNIWLGHAYDAIVQRNTDVFKAHPEYFAQPVAKGEIPVNPKFNVANKEAVDFIVKDVVKAVEALEQKGQSTLLISMEPSDGGGFCNTPACLAIGSPSDQAFYLTNKVAEAFKKRFPGKWIGSYAYNEHITPTKYKMSSNVFVMVTNGFNRSKYTTAELLEAWKKNAGKVGVYEYLSVYEWDNDLPGQVTAAKTDYLKKSVRQYYEKGARAYLGESTMGWVSRGLGQYILSKLLWNVNTDVEAIKNDFFSKAFEKAAAPMSRLYKTWENYPHRIPTDNDLAEWFEWIDEASGKAGNAQVKARIESVKKYLHYIMLYRQLKTKTTRENMLAVLSYANRTFESPSFATLPTMVSLANYSGFSGIGWYGQGDQGWKNDKKPYTNEELDQDLKKDRTSIRKTEGLQSFSRSKKFISLDKIIATGTKKYPESPHAYLGRTRFIVYISAKSASNYFQIRSGFSAAPPVPRNVEIRVYPLREGVTINEEEKPLLKYEQEKKNESEQFSLGSLLPGYYVVDVIDYLKMFILGFSPSVSYSAEFGADAKIATNSSGGLNVFYFYVPAGVKRFMVTKSAILLLRSPAGRVLDRRNNIEESFAVDVAENESGIWAIEGQAGYLYIEGVPPYLGVSPATMLVPSYLKK